MARTPSQMLELGTEAPAFSLPDADGAMHSLDDAAGSEAYLVMFICNHCPFVKHVADELARLARDYERRGVAVFAINSNDVEKYPDDGPAAMKAESASRGYTFPYVLDADQSVAKAYLAACTPDFYLFDANRLLVYRGQLDGSRPGNNVPADGRDLRAALDTVLAGEPVPEDQLPSLGCNIKWKAGNEPAYFG
ncbi:MAG: thioredoxin family protein [Gammaproteobacteria bacterium]|nr:thioredoxin family protein [Gammaproteobacteria bacterium]MBT8105032.1 thioredoxin family protein [Gammaproteobacteria bacterium]NNF49955.1 thioredoxin family protein [Woeseiaceae bacterium]NNK25046.1 thioredoxin family protein [Woeseiaceae bacterium]NNL63566.1 thioredoxin family protein [Woeseiaceae bacterium]